MIDYRFRGLRLDGEGMIEGSLFIHKMAPDHTLLQVPIKIPDQAYIVEDPYITRESLGIVIDDTQICVGGFIGVDPETVSLI